MNLQGKPDLIVTDSAWKMSTTGQNKIRNCVTGHWNRSFVLLTDYAVLKNTQGCSGWNYVWITVDLLLIHTIKKRLKEVLGVSKAMISLKSTYKMKPQKLYFNDVKYIFWRIKGMTSACNAAWVCGTWVSVDATEKLQTCFIAQVWERLSLVWPLGIVCGHNSTNVPKNISSTNLRIHRWLLI